MLRSIRHTTMLRSMIDQDYEQWELARWDSDPDENWEWELQWGVPQHEPFYAAQEQSFDNEIPD